MWVEFVVGSLLFSARFSSGYSGFLSSPWRPTFDSISGSSTSKTLFIYLFISLFIYQETSLPDYIRLLSSFSVPLFSFSLYDLQSPSNNCHTGSNDISNSHRRIPTCTGEVFFGQGTGRQSLKDIGSTFLSSSEDLLDDINIVKGLNPGVISKVGWGWSSG